MMRNMNSPITSQGIVRESYDQFEDEGFEIFDKTAGYYISYQTVKPMGIEKIDRLVERLLSKGIELRFTPNLCPLRQSIVSSDFNEYRIHRFNNAKKL